MTNPPTVTSAGFRASFRSLLDAAIPWRRVQLLATLVLTIFGAIAELVTIGAVLPVLAIAANPYPIDNLPVVGPFLSALSAWLSVGSFVAAALFLTAAAIAATLVRMALMWAGQKFIFGFQQDLLLAIFGRALRQPYSVNL
jgi:hypothetical protein